jgi:hypothetical protein
MKAAAVVTATLVIALNVVGCNDLPEPFKQEADRVLQGCKTDGVDPHGEDCVARIGYAAIRVCAPAQDECVVPMRERMLKYID